MTAIVNTFTKDLLDRVVLIEKGIDGINWAFPRFWEPIGNNKYPGFYNRASEVRPDNTGGQNLKNRKYVVEMRLIVGPLSAGYRGEYEDKGNQVHTAIIDAFDAERRLGYHNGTTSLDPLRYVTSAFLQPVLGGVQPFDYTDTLNGPPLWLLGVSYFLEVQTQFTVPRKS